MNSLALLIPIALMLGLAGLGAFFWALKGGQFEDLEGAANRILIDACIPYDMKMKGTFPPVVDVTPELRATIRAKFSNIDFPK